MMVAKKHLFMNSLSLGIAAVLMAVDVLFTCRSPWRTQHKAQKNHHSRKAPYHESPSIQSQ
jgi:hypothetical protein